MLASAVAHHATLLQQVGNGGAGLQLVVEGHRGDKHAAGAGQLFLSATMPNGVEKHLLIVRIARHQQGKRRAHEVAHLEAMLLAERHYVFHLRLHREVEAGKTSVVFLEVGQQTGLHLGIEDMVDIPLPVLLPALRLAVGSLLAGEVDGRTFLSTELASLIGILNVGKQHCGCRAVANDVMNLH